MAESPTNCAYLLSLKNITLILVRRHLIVAFHNWSTDGPFVPMASASGQFKGEDFLSQSKV